MQLVEKHIINENNSLYKECDRLCFPSKSIYNQALYLIRQEYETSKTYNVLNDSYKYMKDKECFAELPQKVAQATLRCVHATCQSFFRMLHSPKVQNKNVEFPHYLHKTKGRFVTTFNNQTISKKVFEKKHIIKLSQCNIEFYTKIEDFKSINCVRIVPQLEQYTIEVVYTIPDVEPLKSNRTYASIDLGVSNLATITYSDGSQPKIIYHSFLDSDMKRRTVVRFCDNDKRILYNYENNLGIYNIETQKNTSIKIDKSVIAIEETDSLIFVLGKKDNDYTVYIIEKTDTLQGSFSFTADTAFIKTCNNNLYIGQDTSISKVKISKE